MEEGNSDFLPFGGDLYTKDQLLIAVTDCPKGALTNRDIPTFFDGENECKECKHLKYKNGILYCECGGKIG